MLTEKQAQELELAKAKQKYLDAEKEYRRLWIQAGPQDVDAANPQTSAPTITGGSSGQVLSSTSSMIGNVIAVNESQTITATLPLIGNFYSPGGFIVKIPTGMEVQQNFQCPGCKTDLNENDKIHGTCWKCGRKL